MIKFLARLFGFSSESSDSEVVSVCPSCGADLTICTCCYICGDSSRYSCACSVACADAALGELATDIDREESL